MGEHWRREGKNFGQCDATILKEADVLLEQRTEHKWTEVCNEDGRVFDSNKALSSVNISVNRQTKML